MADSNRCRAVVVTCIDFRFVPWVEGFLRSEGLTGAADLIAWPGGGTALALEERDVVLDTLALAVRLHAPDEMVLLAHEDCGRLKALPPTRNADPDSLLRSGLETVRTRFPDARARLAVLSLDGSARWLDAGSG